MDRRNFIRYSAISGGSGLVGLAIGGLAGLTVGYNLRVEDALGQPKENKPSIGDVATDFQLKGLDGKVHQLSQHRGKPVVLNFWETWCRYCKEEMPKLHQMTQLYGDRVVVLAITRDDLKNTAKYIKQNGFNSFAVLLDEDRRTFGEYNVLSIPRTFVIDADGQIVEYNRGTTDFTNPNEPIRQAIDSLLPEKEPKNPRKRRLLQGLA